MTFSPEQITQLYDGVRAIHSTLEPEAALQLVVHEAVGLVNANSGALVLVNPNTGLLEIEASEGLPELDAAHLGASPEGIVSQVVRHGEPLRECGLDGGTHSGLAVPLRMDGRVRAVLNVSAARSDAFSEADQALLEELAVHATQVIQNTWLYEQLRQRTELLESLVSVGQTINRTLILDDVLEAITREAVHGRARCSCSMPRANGSRGSLSTALGRNTNNARH